MVLVGGSLGGLAGAAGAQDGPVGGVSEVAELAENESFSSAGHATVLVYDEASTVASINVFSGQRTALTLPAGFASVRTISEDGSTLIITSQSETIGGDADGGLHDVYLHDLPSGVTTPVSSTVTGATHALVASSADASTIVFQATSTTDTTDVALWAWRDGVTAEITTPSGAAPGFSSFYEQRLRVSGDGSAITGSRQVGPTQVAFHLDLDTDVLTERIVRGFADVGLSSRDGQVVSWLEYGDSVDGYRAEADLVVWRPAGDTIERHTLPLAYYEGPLLLSGDGSTAFLIQYRGTDFEQRSIVAIDTDDGSLREIERRSGSDAGFSQLLAANDDGSRLAFTSFSESFGLDGDYEFRLTFNVWDEDGKPSGSFAPPVLNDQIERLYRAYFGRAPDSAGLGYWIDRRVDGLSLADISQAFASSPEFMTTYGSLDDGSFIDLVYSNVLGRSPDAEGRAFWVGRLAAGVSRGSVMTGFSESAEFAATTNTSAPMSVGEAQVRRLYRAFFDRAPTDAEIANWVSQLDAGVPVSSIAGALAQAPEFAELRNAGSTPNVVSFVISTRFGNGAPDSVYATLNVWFDRTFDGTFDIVAFMLEVANHPEFARRTGLPVN